MPRRAKFHDNLLYLTDSYKHSHPPQFPKGTEQVTCYLESRGGRYGEVTMFGLQYALLRYLEGEAVLQEHLDEAAARIPDHFALNKGVFDPKRWQYIIDEHSGRLPIEIKCVPEGTTVPTHNALYTVTSTDKETYWLPGYLEALLEQVWSPITVCTYSRSMKHLITKYLRQTGTPELIDFKLHDFGFRGVSSVETAAWAGAAHLVNFMGTDTMVALNLIDEYYGERMAGFSIPAAEHSTVTSHGKQFESSAYRNMLEVFPTGPVAVVSDSYDIFNACENIWGTELRQMVIDRNGFLVIRPDSGDPISVVCRIMEILGEKFGVTVNHKGFRVLDQHVRVIQGDGINHEMVDNILYQMSLRDWSADNIAFGSGGALLQKHDRDEQKIAYKCNHIVVDGVGNDVFKHPITDQGKSSKRGQIKLIHSGRSWDTVPIDAPGEDEMVSVFRNGDMLVEYNFGQIRARAA